MPRQPDLPCSLCGHLMWRGTTSLPAGKAMCRPCRRWVASLPKQGKPPRVRPSSRQRICEVCGAAYKATYADQRTCGRKCGAVVNITGRGLQQRDPPPVSCPIDIHPCRACGRLLTRPRRVVCSRECRLLDSRRRSRDTFISKARPVTLECVDCGEPWSTSTATNGGVCERCQRRRAKRRFGSSFRKRARFYGVEYEPVDRMKVYARDKWRCGLCGKPVKRGEQAPHPLAPSLDHILPMSQGGPHTYPNVQLAHFLCNSIKGARGEPQQLRLVG